MIPTSISRHPQSGFIAHYPDRQVAVNQLTLEERDVVLGELVDRFNAHAALAERAARVPEEAHV